MILIGIGTNLPSSHGPPRATAEAALRALEAAGVTVASRSPWYESAPVPVSDQPWFINGVAEVFTDRDPESLLEVLHRIEAQFGRVRGVQGAARTLDLDLLAYRDVLRPNGPAPVLPHPRLHERAFVLFPLRDVAPGWIHPILAASAAALADRIPPGQAIRRISGNS